MKGTESGNWFVMKRNPGTFKIRPIFPRACLSQTGSRLVRPWRLAKFHDSTLAGVSMRRQNLVIPGRNMLLETLWDRLGWAPRPVCTGFLEALRLHRKGGVRPSLHSAARPCCVTWLHDLDHCPSARFFWVQLHLDRLQFRRFPGRVLICGRWCA